MNEACAFVLYNNSAKRPKAISDAEVCRSRNAGAFLNLQPPVSCSNLRV